MRRVTVTVLPVLLLALMGCGPGQATVSGTVALDGKPLEEGNIAFRPLPAKASSEAIGGPIKDGKYEVKARPGLNRVEITATRIVPGKKDNFGTPLRQSIIPIRYNAQSELTKNISVGATKELNFELTSR
jgi:hypothetical protein